MTTSSEQSTRPGKKLGPTNEFTIFVNVKPGHEQQIREALEQKDDQASRVADIEAIGTVHDIRWVLFDNDTRLLFASEFDGDWDAYIDDFATHMPGIFDAVLQHAEDYPGIKDPRIKDFITARQVTAVSYYRGFLGTVKEIKKALAVQEAFQHLLDQAS